MGRTSSARKERLAGEHGLPVHDTMLSYPEGGKPRWGGEQPAPQVGFAHFLCAKEGPGLVSFGLPSQEQGQKDKGSVLAYHCGAHLTSELTMLPQEQMLDLSSHASSGTWTVVRGQK